MKPQRQSSRTSGIRAYTLVEVCIASAVLGLTVVSSLMTMQVGFGMIESARDNALASQILQSEMENLRLKSWIQLSELPLAGEFAVEGAFLEPAAERFACTRTIEETAVGMMRVTLQVTWESRAGVQRTRRYVTYFAKEGLNDYYYRSLPG